MSEKFLYVIDACTLGDQHRGEGMPAGVGGEILVYSAPAGKNLEIGVDYARGRTYSLVKAEGGVVDMEKGEYKLFGSAEQVAVSFHDFDDLAGKGDRDSSGSLAHSKGDAVAVVVLPSHRQDVPDSQSGVALYEEDVAAVPQGRVFFEMQGHYALYLRFFQKASFRLLPAEMQLEEWIVPRVYSVAGGVNVVQQFAECLQTFRHRVMAVSHSEYQEILELLDELNVDVLDGKGSGLPEPVKFSLEGSDRTVGGVSAFLFKQIQA